MITKNQKVKGSVIKVLLTLPVFALLILLNTQCDNTKPNEEKQKAVEVKVDENAGQLLGTILDRFTEKPIALATILLEKDGKELYYTTSDKNGRYEITKINASAYNVKVSCEGYETVTIRDVNIPVKKLTFQDFWLKNKEASAAPSQEVVVGQDSIHRVTEVMPQYPGGPNEMMKYISDNIKYPQSAKDNKIEGRVYVSFVVEKDGSITNAAVMRGIDKECDAEALRVVASMPKWTPGQHKGEVVRTQFTIPIYYKLNN
jgi:TonB family protein